MDAELDKLIAAQWSFLYQDWSGVKRTTFHHTDIKAIQNMRKVKDLGQHRLGITPVFFFLAVLFGTKCSTGPYRNVEKGIIILFMLLQGTTISDMGAFLPKSSFHEIFKSFFGTNTNVLYAKITSCLAEMCSSIKLRLLCSRSTNLEIFKHITLHLGGHDSRVAYRTAEKASMYSYRLRKSGFRTQACYDMNSMVVIVSQPAECRDFDVGTMLSKMAIHKKIHHLDCLALDGGFTLHMEGIIAASDTLTSSNFCHPICKRKGIELTEEEIRYNVVFDSFRFKAESYFGDMQTTFTKFSHTAVNRVSEKGILPLQCKLCCLFSNIKRMDDFDYPNIDDSANDMQATASSFKAKASDAKSICWLQEKFLRLSIGGHETDQEMDNDDGQDYVIQKILGRRGEGESIEFYVLWKGYNATQTTWEVSSQFNDYRVLEDYWNSPRNF